jgi:predicted amidohydrolase YtcJ
MSDDELDQLQAALAKYADDPLFKAGAMSLTLDDAASTNQAVMVDAAFPSASASVPAPHFAVDPFNRLVRRLDARGWQVLTKAGGDLAVRMALDAYEHAARSNPSRKQSRRHRIEGPLAVSDTDLARFGKLAVLASVRPFQIPRLEGTKSRTATAATVAPARLAQGVSNARGRVVFGSGWPAAPLDPLLGLASMTEGSEGRSAGAPGLSLKLAIDAYTAGSAWASFDEQRKGSIAPGMLADLVVLSTDVFDGAAGNVAAASVDVTIFDGKVVYRRGQRGTN